MKTKNTNTQPRKRGRPSKAAKAAEAAATPRPKMTNEEKLAKLLADKDTVMASKYPHYVTGSVRLSTPEDLGGKAKKFVALIKCECGNTRLVSTSDVFQVTKCLKCSSGVEEDIEALKAKLAAAEEKRNAIVAAA